jgi:hypothetical protein
MYHASPVHYDDGSEIPVPDREYTDADKKRAEDVLERHRAGRGCGPRRQAIFCTDSPWDARHYAVSENWPEVRVYEVHTDDEPTWHPTALVTRAAYAQDADGAAEGYWDPDAQWRFREYLCRSARVVKQIPMTPNTVEEMVEVATASKKWLDDSDRAKTYFPERPTTA